MESGIAKKNVNILLFLAVSILCSPSVFAEPVPIVPLVPPNSVANNSAPIPALRPAVGNSVHVPRPDVPGDNGNHDGFGKGNGNHGLGNNGNHNGFDKGNGHHGQGNNGNHDGFGKGNGNHGLGNNGNHNGFDKGNGNHGQGNNGNHDGFGKGNGNHGQGNNGSHNGAGNGNHGLGNNGNHNGNGKGNGNHDKDKNGNHGWGGKDDSDRRNSFKDFNRKHKVDLPNVVGKYQNANASCGSGNSSPKQTGHGEHHGIEKVPQINVSDNQTSAATAGLGTLVGSDVKDKTVVPVQASEVQLPTGTANTIDINGDNLIHLETTAPIQPNSEVPSEVSHGHTFMTVHEVKQVLNDLVSLGSVAEAEVMSIAKNGEVVLHTGESSSPAPTVEPLVNTIVNNPAPQAEVSVAPSVPPVEKISESISPNILDSSSSQTVINNPLTASLKNSDIQSISEYSNSGKPSQLENTNQSLIVVGQVVKVSGSAIEIDQNGTSHALNVGNNVHLGSKFKFEGGAGNLVIRSFTGELINVEV